jgi:hypothetical protein
MKRIDATLLVGLMCAMAACAVDENPPIFDLTPEGKADGFSVTVPMDAHNDTFHYRASCPTSEGCVVMLNVWPSEIDFAAESSGPFPFLYAVTETSDVWRSRRIGTDQYHSNLWFQDYETSDDVPPLEPPMTLVTATASFSVFGRWAQGEVKLTDTTRVESLSVTIGATVTTSAPSE